MRQWVQVNVAGKRPENEGPLILCLFMSVIVFFCLSTPSLWMDSALRREREK